MKQHTAALLLLVCRYVFIKHYQQHLREKGVATVYGGSSCAD